MKNAFSSLAAFLLIALAIPQPARAGFSLGEASNFAVLYEGTGGHNLSITNVTINGNVGVGGTGVVQDSGPSAISGAVYFQAPNTGQFHNNNGSNTFGGPAVFDSTTGKTPFNVQDALSTVNSLSTSAAAEAGTSIVINGTQTLQASSGTLDPMTGNEVFNVTSYSEGNGQLLTINGNGHNVVLNLNVSGNPQLGGDVMLTGGLTPDQVLWNYTGTNNLGLNNNASSFPLLAFMGVILAPNAAISVVNSNLDGRVFGGDSSDMQIVSGDTINAPPSSVPEPKSLLLTALMGLAIAFVASRTRSFSRQ